MSVEVAAVQAESKFRSYLRLGKFDVYDYYLGILIVAAAVQQDPATLALFLLGQIAVIVAGVTLDDITGFRDGSDQVNYGSDDPLRKKLRKPLVAGTLTVTEALRFAGSAATLGALLWTGAVVTAAHQPVWTVVLLVVVFAASLQYSYGLRLSYHGFQEAFLVVLGMTLVLVPFGLITGEFSGFMLVQAVLFGMGPLMFGVYSNTNDTGGDRAVGRPTVAALTSAEGNAKFIAALSICECMLIAAASLTGIAPTWFVLLLLPAMALRLRQFHLGFIGGDIMRARKLGFTVHRVYVCLLIVANILVVNG